MALCVRCKSQVGIYMTASLCTQLNFLGLDSRDISLEIKHLLLYNPVCPLDGTVIAHSSV